MRSKLFHVLLTLILLASARVASAQEFKAGDIVVSHPWSRATPTGAKVGAGYFVIENRGKTPDRLLGGSVEAAASFEIHDTVVEDGVMRMRELKSLELAPGGSIEAKPGGRHVMFGGLLHPLAAGGGRSEASSNSSTPAGSRSSLTLSGWGPRHRVVAAIERVFNF
jgi:copper(I)-binding protein